jgi:ankyrin repeat protein
MTGTVRLESFRAVHGDTPLISAAARENFEVVKLLLGRGANIETKDNRGDTALIRAAGQGTIG